MYPKTQASPTAAAETECAETSDGTSNAANHHPMSASPTTLCKKERTDVKVLLLAASFGSARNIRKLLAKGVDVNAQDEFTGQTALHVAVQHNHTGLCEFLLHNGAHVNAVDKSGQTPLHEAIRTIRVDLVSLLLEKDADPNILDSQRMIPLDHLFSDETDTPGGGGDDSTIVSSKGFSTQHSSSQSVSSWLNHLPAKNLISRRLLRQPASARKSEADRHRITDLLQSAGSFPPIKDFYATLFSFGNSKGVSRWFERLRLSIKNIHDCRIFYTLASAAEGLRILTAAQARNLTSEFVSEFCALCCTVEARQVLVRLVNHAENRNRIDKRCALFAKSYLSSCEIDPTRLEARTLRQCVKVGCKDMRAIRPSRFLKHLTEFREECFKARELQKGAKASVTKEAIDIHLMHGLMGLISAILCAILSHCEYTDQFQLLCQKTFDFVDNKHLDEVILFEDLEAIGGSFGTMMGSNFITSPQDPVEKGKLRCGARMLAFCVGAFGRLRLYMDEGLSPLHSECCQNDFSPTAIRSIVVTYPDMVFDRDPEGCLPLHRMCLRSADSNIEEFQGAILEAIDILASDYKTLQETDNQGRTPLHYACMAKVPRYAVVKSLVTKNPGAVVQRDDNGDLPLHLACRRQKVTLGTVKRVVPSPADRKILQHRKTSSKVIDIIPTSSLAENTQKDKRSPTVDESNTINGGQSTGIGGQSTIFGSQSVTVESKENTEERNNVTFHYQLKPETSERAWYQTGAGDTLTTLAVRHRLGSDVINYIDSICPELLEAETRLSEEDCQRCKLHFAIHRNDRSSFKKLMRSVFGKVNEVDSEGRSPLDLAAMMGRKRMFETLVENGAQSKLYGSGSKLRTLLLVRETTFRPVIEVNTDKRIMTDMGNDGSASTLSGCSQTSNQTIFRDAILSEHDQANHALHRAVNENDLDKFFAALEETDTDEPDEEGRSALDFAALQGREEMFETLHERGARPNLYKSINVLRAMLEVRVRVRLREVVDDTSVDSPLSAAIHPGRDSESHQSWRSSASRRSRAYQIFDDAYLSTEDASHLPLHKAIMDNAPDVISSFDGDDSAFNEVDSKGRSPLDLAAFTGQRQLFELVLKRGSRPAALPSLDALRAMLDARAPHGDDPSIRSSRSHKMKGTCPRRHPCDKKLSPARRSKKPNSSRKRSNETGEKLKRESKLASIPGDTQTPSLDVCVQILEGSCVRSTSLTEPSTVSGKDSSDPQPMSFDQDLKSAAVEDLGDVSTETKKFAAPMTQALEQRCHITKAPKNDDEQQEQRIHKNSQDLMMIQRISESKTESSNEVPIETVFTVQYEPSQVPMVFSQSLEERVSVYPDPANADDTNRSPKTLAKGALSLTSCHAVSGADKVVLENHAKSSHQYTAGISDDIDAPVFATTCIDDRPEQDSGTLTTQKPTWPCHGISAPSDHADPSLIFQDSLLPTAAEAAFPLHKAIKQGSRRDLVKQLRKNSEKDLQCVDSWGRSPLDLAAMTGQRDLFDMLLARGAQATKFPSVAELRKVLDQREPHMEEYYFLP